MMNEGILEIQGLNKSFGGLVALHGLDFHVKSNEILGLIGPNGAGKTTVFNLITGFDRPDSGGVLFQGDEIVGLQPFEICQRGITRTFQQARPMYGMSIIENIVVGSLNRISGLTDAFDYSMEVLEFVGLADFRDTLAENLPIGYRKLLEIAKCLATKPKLLLLDEVMAGLTPSEMMLILRRIQSIRESGVTILLIEHVMEAVMTICDRIVVLNYGRKICQGSPDEVVKDKNVIEAYLGDDFS